MNSPRLRRGESPFPRTSFAGCRETVSQPRVDPLKPRGTLGGYLEPSRCRAYGRGPLERDVRTLLAQGVRRGRGRAHGHGAIPHAEDWRNKYIAWMDRGELRSDRSEARRIARMAKSFTLVDGELYKRTALGVLQRCVPIPQGRELLRDIHAGVCGHHAAPRTLVGNAFRQGFYWPTAVVDASEIVRTCEGCQFYARKTNLPAHALQMIPVTWPFAVWGLAKGARGLHPPTGCH
jgi:hypothetical protein